ncbi:MAG: hypothetical protein Q7T89_10830 [Anaerolineales bacterium]|nr:hypothetical protein [Anaerolineales bacterium]
METIDFQYGHFLVDERAFCVWDKDIKEITLDFLANVDPEYFEYLADVNYENLESEDEKVSQHAAVAIRAAFSQGLETLFAFIFAAIQAPHCVSAWMSLYKSSELYKLVRKVSKREKILSLLKTKAMNWQVLSNVVHESLVLEDKDKENIIKNGFGQLWSQFASAYLQDGFSTEYNSIKHGLRVKPGGFSLAIGVEDKPGVHAPPERMVLMGKSKFGTSYYDVEQIEDLKRHIQIRRNSRNWSPEDMVWGLKLISTSISNIISALKIFNGIKADEVQFHWPNDLEAFKEPSKRAQSLGVTSISGFKTIIPKEVVTDFSKDEIIQKYLDGKFLGAKRFKLDNQE